MADNTTSVSMVINASVEQVWPFLIEHQQSNTQKYLQSDTEGEIVAGQVIRTGSRFLPATIYIDQVVQVEPPMTGQTIYARLSLLGKEGKCVSSQFLDSERYHIQIQAEVKHPWCTLTAHTNIHCMSIDTISCVIAYVEQSEMTLRLLPRWLTRKLNNDKTIEKSAIEEYLQKIKTKAEQSINQTIEML